MACVLIEVNEQGQASVGAYPSEQIPQEIKASLQPVESVEAALEKARTLLSEAGEREGPGDPDSGAGEQSEAQASASFDRGYASARGTPMFEAA